MFTHRVRSDANFIAGPMTWKEMRWWHTFRETTSWGELLLRNYKPRRYSTLATSDEELRRMGTTRGVG